MMLQKQLIETNVMAGVWGDCYRTALAVVLNMTAHQVPHFYEDNVPSDQPDKWDWGSAILEWINTWLREQGYVRFALFFSADDVESALKVAGMVASGQPYLLSGSSPQGIAHVVVCRGDKIVWDPSKHNLGIVAPLKINEMWQLEIIARPVEDAVNDKTIEQIRSDNYDEYGPIGAS